MSSTGTYAQSGPSVARAPGNALVAAAMLGLFVLAAILSAARKDITQGFDEVAHVSYVAQIQHDGEAAPVLETMRLLDPRTFQFTGAANYLNHPPMFYALLALLGPTLEGHPQALFADRLIDIAIAALGFAALLGLGVAARLSREEFYAYAVPLGCIPVLVPLAGAVNNDNLAFCGGAIAMLGVWQTLTSGRESWLVLALVGVVAAGWAKSTGLLLFWAGRRGDRVSALAQAIARYLDRRRVTLDSHSPRRPTLNSCCATAARRRKRWRKSRCITEAPAPPAGPTCRGNRFRLSRSTSSAPSSPTGCRRSATATSLNYAMLVIPVAAIGCAQFAGLVVVAAPLMARGEKPRSIFIALAPARLATRRHLRDLCDRYSYGRYVATGWLMDAYPRYYLPLSAIVPLACLSLVRRDRQRRAGRTRLLVFLIAGPVIFRISAHRSARSTRRFTASSNVLGSRLNRRGTNMITEIAQIQSSPAWKRNSRPA